MSVNRGGEVGAFVFWLGLTILQHITPTQRRSCFDLIKHQNISDFLFMGFALSSLGCQQETLKMATQAPGAAEHCESQL